MNLASTWPSPRTTVARWAILVLPWLIVITLLVGVTMQLGRTDLLEMVRDGGRASATVTSTENGVIEVTYQNEQVGTVTTEVVTDDAAVGDTVEIVYDRDNPFRVRPSSERVRSDLTWFLVGLATFVGLVSLAFMQWSARRFRSLARRPTTAFRTRAIIHSRPRMRVPKLSLFPLDAEFGDRCLCTVRLADLEAEVNEHRPIEVDVKGFPRSGGRVVVRHGDTVLWPRGRALLTTRYRWPIQLDTTTVNPSSRARAGADPRASAAADWPNVPPLTPIAAPPPMRPMLVQSRSWGRAWVLPALAGIGVVSTIAVTIVTAANGRAVDEWTDNGLDAVAIVAARPDGDFQLAVDVRVVGAPETKPMMAPVADPGDYEAGDAYPAVVDERGTQVRLRTEPYDRWTPRLWLLVPTLFVAWLLLRRAFNV